MAKTVPTTLVLPDVGRFSPGESVTVFDWDRLNEALNYHYARMGSHCGGMIFDPAWSTTSTSYVTANSTASKDYDLDDWQGLFRFTRLMYESGSAASGYQIRLDAFAENLDVRATLTRMDGGSGSNTSSSTPFTLTASTVSGDSEWVSADLGFTPAAASAGGAGATPAHFLIYVEAKVPVAGTGYLHTFSLRETVLAGADLPRG